MTAADSYVAPGPGAWELETTHYSRPVTLFTQEACLKGFAQGFRESSTRFGLMLSHLEPAYSRSFTYMRAVGFGAPPKAKGPPPKLVMQALTRIVPSMRRRMQTAHDAMENKIWRAELKRWDEQVKPAAIAKHQALQDIDLAALSDAELASHVREASSHLAAMIRQHHEFTITVAVPLGDFLAHVQRWTGKPAGEVLRALKGSSQVSLGVAEPELAQLAAALASDGAAREMVYSTQDAQAVVDSLLQNPATSAAMKAYMSLVWVRCMGYDLGSKSFGEMPELSVRAIRAAIENIQKEPQAGKAANEGIDAIRSSVPAEHHRLFDALLEEALLINRLRDERGHFSDGWALGIARRALAEAGRRLQARGTLSSAELAYDGGCEEIVALLQGQPGVSEETLQARSQWRKTKTTADADVPPWLGAPPSPPPPAAWLPPKGRRAAEAMDAFMAAMFGEPEAQTTSQTVKGLSVSPGSYEGIARVIHKEEDFATIQKGDILIAKSTSPYFNVVLPLLGAIVTDRGGQLCHAAIVARECGIPGVVGTRDATKIIHSGSRVRVDGNSGLVTLLA